MQNWLIGEQKTYGIMRSNVTATGLKCAFNQMMGTAKKFVACIQDTINFLNIVQAPVESCPFCGDRLLGDGRLVGVNGKKMHAHEHCFDEYVNSVKLEENIAAAAPNQIGRGIAGGLLFALGGGIVWMALYYIGFLSYIAALLIALGVSFGWDKFGGKNNKGKIVAMWIISLVVLVIAMLASYCIDVAVAMRNEGVEGNVFEVFIYLIKEVPEYGGAILIDTCISCVLLLLADILNTVTILKSQKQKSVEFVKY